MDVGREEVEFYRGTLQQGYIVVDAGKQAF
jgi:hypothetical protein